MPEWAFNTFIAVFAEFMGTTFFLFFALAGCQVTHLSPTAVTFPGPAGSSPQTFVSVSSLLYAALAVGFSLAVNAWVFFRVTSALFNPAITLGMVFVGSLAWKRAACLAVSQMLGGMAAAGLVSCMFPGDIRATETLLGRETSVVRGFFIEVLLTAAFVFSVFMLAADKHKGTVSSPDHLLGVLRALANASSSSSHPSASVWRSSWFSWLVVHSQELPLTQLARLVQL